ncbi:hypothetical protein [Desnuesiella massiliensis]|uniref:hypothetical protein n=1 Tax=Desnuesiella massiliensis TaxID=1650662 RepID=UPI0012B548D8|nr:hypothetical protein [Desnuesiella massiliensis]
MNYIGIIEKIKDEITKICKDGTWYNVEIYECFTCEDLKFLVQWIILRSTFGNVLSAKLLFTERYILCTRFR